VIAIASLAGVLATAACGSSGDTTSTGGSEPAADACCIVPDLSVAVGELGVAAALRDAGLTLGTIEQELAEAVAEPGDVIGQAPSAFEIVSPGTEVDVVIAVGDDVRRVPDVLGSTFERAAGTLVEAGMTIGRVDPAPQPGAIITSQAPSPGAEANEGAPVDLSLVPGQ
jgi:beta-lactam-binding protein with PASTA domain